MVISALIFPEINWIRNLSKRTMLAGWRWSSAFHLCWWHPGYVKNKAGLWKISRSVEDWIQDQRARKAQTNTGCLAVWSLWKMGFHSVDASLLKNLYKLFLSTKKTRSTSQWSPIRLQESSSILKMIKLTLICTASSSKLRCSSQPGQDKTFHIKS